jgi:predicted alpha-1,6-mannanase (GH76 family)
MTFLVAAMAMAAPMPVQTWGAETLAQIRTHLYESGGLYFEEVAERPQPAFMWPAGVQLSALAAASGVDASYTSQLNEFVHTLRRYWQEHEGIAGYDVLPAPKPSDRYYDDNAWIVLGLLEAHEVTKNPEYLRQAEETMRFVLSGEDEALGGGIYWKENERTSKNTCSNAPTATAAFRLYHLTGKKSYLEIGQRLLRWLDETLQDRDGLYWDNINLEGKIERTKWSYNTALVIRALCELSDAVKPEDQAHAANLLRRASAIALAAEKRWVRPNGAIADDAAFAHLLVDAFIELYRRDQNPRWRTVVLRSLDFLRQSVRDQHGFYGPRWEVQASGPHARIRLIDQASAARAYWMAARHLME